MRRDSIDSEPVNHYNNRTGSVNHCKETKPMSTDRKRFIVSVTPEMGIALEAFKEAEFCDRNRNEMLRYLNIAGAGNRQKGQPTKKRQR